MPETDNVGVATVWLLIKFDWETQDVLAAYETETEARWVLNEIKAVAKRHRIYEDTCHPLEQNLGLQQVKFGHAVTFAEAMKR